MRKIAFLIAALSLATSLPAMAHIPQDVGGHYRHMHRDWSQQQGGHTHNVCWEWDPGEGWVWVCR